MRYDHAVRYGPAHRKLRAELVAAYVVGQPCALCGHPMRDHPSRLDLAHEGPVWVGLSHRRCNRGDAAKIANRTRVGKLLDPAPTPRTRW